MRLATTDGVIHIGILKYERLPIFCFQCGYIEHRYHDCQEKLSHEPDVT